MKKPSFGIIIFVFLTTLFIGFVFFAIEVSAEVACPNDAMCDGAGGCQWGLEGHDAEICTAEFCDPATGFATCEPVDISTTCTFGEPGRQYTCDDNTHCVCNPIVTPPPPTPTPICSGSTPCGTYPNCTANNACGTCGSLPSGYGNSCGGGTSPANSCGQTQLCPTGTIQCDGSCSAATCSAPADPPGLGSSCSDGDACTTGETVQCGGSCSGGTNNPVNGGWGGWSAWSCGGWSICSGTTQSRTCTRARSCDSPSPSCGGSNCSDSGTEITTQTQTCTPPPSCTDNCPSGDYSSSCTDGACCSSNTGQSCNDGNSCITGETIQCNGSCSGGAASGNHKACSGTSCVSVSNTSSACTNSCTSDANCGGCVPTTGQSCSDGNSCTTGETIQCNGSCGGGTASGSHLACSGGSCVSTLNTSSSCTSSCATSSDCGVTPTPTITTTPTPPPPPPGAAVCDSTWRDTPYQDFADNGKLSAAQNTSGVFLYWPRRYLPWPLYSGGFIQNKCAFGAGGDVCLWQNSEILKYDFNGSLVYAQDPNNIFVRANQNCDTYGSCSGPYSTWKYVVGTWTDLGDIAEPWNTPTSVTDKDGRLWQFRTWWNGSVYKAQYQCSSPACTTLTFHGATSGFSTNPNGPAQASLSVAPNAAFYAFVDYGQQTDSIIAPSVGVSYACTWDNAWIGTAGRFRCTASAAIGSYTYTSGTNNYPYPSSNICASGPTSIGALTVTIINQPPTVPSVTVTESDYCSSFGAYVNWTYSDPDGDSQSAYQVQVDNNGSFNSPEVDTGKISGGGTSYFASGGLAFNITYKARVKVWDSHDAVSNWTESGSWKTPKHAYPYTDFTYTPSTDIPAKQPVQFTDQTIFYDGGGNRVWSWAFGDGGTSGVQNPPPHTYNLPGLYQSSLIATDKDNYSCSRTKPVTVAQPVPVWKEVSPR